MQKIRPVTLSDELHLRWKGLHIGTANQRVEAFLCHIFKQWQGPNLRQVMNGHQALARQ